MGRFKRTSKRQRCPARSAAAIVTSATSAASATAPNFSSPSPVCLVSGSLVSSIRGWAAIPVLSASGAFFSATCIGAFLPYKPDQLSRIWLGNFVSDRSSIDMDSTVNRNRVVSSPRRGISDTTPTIVSGFPSRRLSKRSSSRVWMRPMVSTARPIMINAVITSLLIFGLRLGSRRARDLAM